MKKKTYSDIFVLVCVGRFRLAFAATPVKATTATKTATTTGYAETEYHQKFTPFTVDQQIGLEIFLAKLLGQL